jgi:hypothetical protein
MATIGRNMVRVKIVINRKITEHTKASSVRDAEYLYGEIVSTDYLVYSMDV